MIAQVLIQLCRNGVLCCRIRRIGYNAHVSRLDSRQYIRVGHQPVAAGKLYIINGAFFLQLFQLFGQRTEADNGKAHCVIQRVQRMSQAHGRKNTCTFCQCTTK